MKYRVRTAVVMADHRINPGEPGRRLKIGDTVTAETFEDRDRYPGPTNLWALVWGGHLEPSDGWDWFTASDLPQHANPSGYISKGDRVCAAHFPDSVNVDALVAEGHLEPEAKKKATKPPAKKGS